MTTFRSIINNHPVIFFIMVFLFMMSLSRLFQLLFLVQDVPGFTVMVKLIFQGECSDVSLLSILIGLPVSLIPLVSISKSYIKPYRFFLRVYFLFVIGFAFMIEYLMHALIYIYGLEAIDIIEEILNLSDTVFDLLLRDYFFVLIAPIVVVISLVFFINRQLKIGFRKSDEFSIFMGIPSTLFLLLFFLLGEKLTSGQLLINRASIYNNEPSYDAVVLNSTYVFLSVAFKKD